MNLCRLGRWLVAALQLAMLDLCCAADKVKVTLAATDDAIYLPFFIAADNGYYNTLELDVEYIFAGGGVATPALMSGTIDFSTSAGTAVSAIIKGASLKVIMNTSETVPWKLWATQPDIKTLADLKGKSVGVQTRGDLFELSMRAVLRKAGLPGDWVIYTPLGFGSAQRLSVIQTGSLPSILLTYLEERVAREQGLLKNAHVLVDVGKDVKIPYNGIATRDALLTAKPAVVERFAQATLMGMRYMDEQREGALDVFARRAPGIARDILHESITETASTMLQSGVTSSETQQTEISLRALMLGAPERQAMSPSKVFDYAPTLRATRVLETNNWKP
jgi:NitT/TauT family transport system substrate-binding protein